MQQNLAIPYYHFSRNSHRDGSQIINKSKIAATLVSRSCCFSQLWATRVCILTTIREIVPYVEEIDFDMKDLSIPLESDKPAKVGFFSKRMSKGQALASIQCFEIVRFLTRVESSSFNPPPVVLDFLYLFATSPVCLQSLSPFSCQVLSTMFGMPLKWQR